MPADLPSVMDIAPGQIWYAEIERLGEEAGQVRYRLRDAAGQAMGGELSLDKNTFQRRFCAGPQGWRRWLRVAEVGRGSVLYQELDAAGQPLNEGQRCSLVLFVRNFKCQEPEAGKGETCSSSAN